MHADHPRTDLSAAERDRSLEHSIKDARAFSVMTGSVETYFSAFALALRATPGQVALVATAPNLIGSVGQLASAWLGHKLNRRRPLILVGVLLQVLVLMPTAILPLLFPDFAIPILMVCLTVYYGAAHFSAPQWMSLMGELVPERRRGRFFARRTAVAQASAFIALFMGGVILQFFQEHAAATWGFVTLFVIATIARSVSLYHLYGMREPNPHAASVETASHLAWLRRPEFRPALRFSLFFVLMQSAVGVSAPFFTVYMLQELHFSYFQFMMNTGTSVLVQFLTLRNWGRISDVAGNRVVLVTTGFVLPILPALWLVSGEFWYLLAVQVVSGSMWAGFSLSAGNIIYDAVPREKRATYQALQNVIMAGGVFIGSMFGVLVTQTMAGDPGGWGLASLLPSSLMWAFLVSALLRLAISSVFLPRITETRRTRHKLSPYQLIYRFTGLNAFSGIVYDVVAKARRTTTPSEDEDKSRQDDR